MALRDRIVAAINAGESRKRKAGNGVQAHASSMVGGERGEALKRTGVERIRNAAPQTPPSAPQTPPRSNSNVAPAEGRLLSPFTCLPRCRLYDEGGEPIVWPWEPTGEASPLRQAQMRSPLPVDAGIRHALNSAVHSGDGGESSTGVRAWKGFCEKLGISPHIALSIQMNPCG